jgi:hypothetical protein
METKRDQTIAVLGAILVLFTAIIDPRVTIALSIVAFIVLLVNQFRTSGKQTTDNQERP